MGTLIAEPIILRATTLAGSVESPGNNSPDLYIPLSLYKADTLKSRYNVQYYSSSTPSLLCWKNNLVVFDAIFSYIDNVI